MGWVRWFDAPPLGGYYRADYTQRILHMKVMVVDDSAVELTRLRQIVERAGHQVITASDGLEAVERAAIEQPDLIFMDIVMPRMDGFRATRTLVADSKTAHLPIILVSTKSQPVDIAWARKQGAAHLIGKPYAPAEILEQLAKFQARAAAAPRVASSTPPAASAP